MNFNDYVIIDGVEFIVHGECDVLREDDINTSSRKNVKINVVFMEYTPIEPTEWKFRDRTLEELLIEELEK